MTATETTNAAAVEEKEPEFVLTPDILAYENRRTDLVLAGFVLLAAFFLGTHRDGSADVWRRFATGRLITEQGIPRVDPFLYTRESASWVNPSWLFDLLLYLGYAGPGLSEDGSANVGDYVVGVAKAAMLAGTVAVLLLIRHPGPTLWWSTLVGLGVTFVMSLVPWLAPEIVANLLLVTLLYLWFQARHRNRPGLLYLAVPLAIIWANVDLSFPLAAVVLAVIAVGELIQGLVGSSRVDASEWAAAPSKKALVIGGVAIACLVAGAVSPYTISNWTFPYEWFRVLPKVPVYDREQSGWLTMRLSDLVTTALAGRLVWGGYAWLLLLVANIAAFAMNYRRFQVSRLFLFLLAVALPTLLTTRYFPMSAVLLGFVLSLNGQEFFLARFGTEPRIATGWLLWSQVGRGISVLLMAGAIMLSLTGRMQGIVSGIGFGPAEETFMKSAAEWLAGIDPKGRVFAFNDRIASYMEWKFPNIQHFADGRWQLTVGHTPDGEESTVMDRFSLTRRSLAQAKGVDPSEWKKTFQSHGISYLVIPPEGDMLGPAIRMLNSESLAPVYISDQAVVIAHTGSQHVDQNRFAEVKIDANKLVFREGFPEPPMSAERYVSSPGWLDAVWRARSKTPEGVLTGSIYSINGIRGLAHPGADYLAVRAFRNAIARSADNSEAYLQLGLAYENIYREERSRLLKDATRQRREERVRQQLQTLEKRKQPPTSLEKMLAAMPQVELIPPSASTSVAITVRQYQIMSAYQAAVTADPENYRAHFRMYETSSRNGFIDLAAHHLDEFIRKFPRDPSQPDAVVQQFGDTLLRLQSEVAARKVRYDQVVEEQNKYYETNGLETDRPIDRGLIAWELQLPMLAREQFDLALPYSPEVAQASMRLTEIHLMLGMVEQAFQYFQTAQSQRNPAGLEKWYMGLIHLLTGQYAETTENLEIAIASVRRSQVSRVLQVTDGLTRAGALIAAPYESEDLFGENDREAVFLFTLGLTRIEMGEPALALKEFKEILSAFPRAPFRPVIEYYWPLLTNEPIPPRPAAPASDEKKIASESLSRTGTGAATEKVGPPVVPPNEAEAKATPKAAEKKPASEATKAVEKKPANDVPPKAAEKKPADAATPKAAEKKPNEAGAASKDATPAPPKPNDADKDAKK